MPHPDGRPFVAETLKAQKDRIEALEAALRRTNKIVAEGAATGFNCHDGDWAERLFANQGKITKVLQLK